MEVYIGLEGYTLSSGFILKELCVLFPNGEYCYHLMAAPREKRLTNTEKRTVRYATHNLNGLSYSDGDTPYDCIGDILSKYQDCRIFTYSEVGLNFLQCFLPTTIVINVQDMGFQLPTLLPNPGCCRIHAGRYCAKAKSYAIQTFLLEYRSLQKC